MYALPKGVMSSMKIGIRDMFEADELRLHLKIRASHESNITRSPSVEKYMQFIQHEKSVLIKVIKRSKEIENSKVQHDIKCQLALGVNKIYDLALSRFPNEYLIYVSYFEFLKKANLKCGASFVILRMIKNCSNILEAWLIAAKWYTDILKNVKTARKIILKGLTYHPDSVKLHLERVKLEAVVQFKQKSTNKSQDTSTHISQKLKNYISFICSYNDGYNCLLELLTLLEAHQIEISLQNFVIDKLIETYSTHKQIWHYLAQRETRGLHYGKLEDNATLMMSDPTSLCIAKYQEGLRKVSLSDKADLWSTYLRFLFELFDNNIDLSNVEIIKNLKLALCQASKEMNLSEEFYVKWLKFASQQEEFEILERGTKTIPFSETLWKLRLQYAITSKNKTIIQNTFYKGSKILKHRSLELWKMYLEYALSLSEFNLVESIFNEAIKEPEEISEMFKPNYIEWVGKSQGIEAARFKYNEIVKKRPFCKALHIVMLSLELKESDKSFKNLVSIVDNACTQFGASDVSIWIARTEFHILYDNDNVKKIVEEMYNKALKTLPHHFHSNFKQMFFHKFLNKKVIKLKNQV